MISKLRINQKGDTIVEVLIAMAILGVVLAGAYITANRSLEAEHTAQEHSQGLTIAQSQVEDLSAGDKLNGTCFDPSNPSNNAQLTNCYWNNTETQFCSNQTLSQCEFQYPGAAYWYTISDTSYASSLRTTQPTFTYEVQVTWPNLSGSTASIQLYYRPD